MCSLEIPDMLFNATNSGMSVRFRNQKLVTRGQIKIPITPGAGGGLGQTGEDG